MPTRKLADPEPFTFKLCTDSDHSPPSHQLFENGTYEHTCPRCGVVTVFTVSRPVFWGDL